MFSFLLGKMPRSGVQAFRLDVGLASDEMAKPSPPWLHQLPSHQLVSAYRCGYTRSREGAVVESAFSP